MFPPTPHHLADVARVGRPTSDASPGAAWLMATAARGAEVHQQVAQHHNRDTLVTLHAHYSIEDPRFDLFRVAADLHVSLRRRAQATDQRVAAEVALFRVARRLLDELTTPWVGELAA